MKTLRSVIIFFRKSHASDVVENVSPEVFESSFLSTTSRQEPVGLVSYVFRHDRSKPFTESIRPSKIA